MAGLAVWGDLTDALVSDSRSPSRIVESVKLSSETGR